MRRNGYGLKDGSQRGWLEGGRGRNRTSDCRHPLIKQERNQDSKEVKIWAYNK